MKAIILGASGLVGGLVLKELVANDKFTSIQNIVRKETFQDKKVQNKIIDFDKMNLYEESFTGDVLFCCLGTTIKIAKSKEAFRKVDHDYIIEAAKIAKKNKVKKFLVVSAMGVDSNSLIFYNQVKGQTESALKEIGFESLQIYRPSLLLGDRKEFRLGEEIGNIISNVFSFAFIGDLKKYKPIQAEKVANSMIDGALNRNGKIEIIESDEMNFKV